MHFKKIHLRDFGIFSNQELSDLSDGIIVIGGSNRAGKTTFLQALRYLGYGLPQDGSIPPATDEYYLASEVVTQSGDLYSLTLNGYAQPKVSLKRGSGPEIISPIKLYNDLDQFTYQQIFTISLAELQKIPAGIKNNKEKNRLYSILLGAGLTEIIKLPEIAKSYFGQAKAIGGKLGNPGVAEFKPYYTQIQDALRDKKAALNQVDTYMHKQEQIEKIERHEEETRQKIAELEVQQVRLDVLKNNYSDYNELKHLETQLNEHKGRKLPIDRFSQEDKQQALRLQQDYYRQQEEYKDLKADFQSEIVDENWLEIKVSLLKQKGEIENYLAQLSGIREKVKNFKETKDNIQEKWEQLEADAVEINSTWQGQLEQIEEIKIDKIEKTKLNQIVEDFVNIKNRIEQEKTRQEELKKELELQERLLQSEEPGNPDKVLRNSYILGGVSLILGIISGIFYFIPGFAGAGAGLIFTFIYYTSRFQAERTQEKNRADLKNTLEEIKIQLENKQAEITKLKKDKADIDEHLDKYRRILGLSKQESPGLITTYYSSLEDKKRRYQQLQNDEERLSQNKKDIKKLLFKIYEILRQIAEEFAERGLPLPEKTELMGRSEEIFQVFGQLESYLNKALKLEQSRRRLEDIQGEIQDFLAEHKMTAQSEEEKHLQEYINRAELFLDFSQVELDYNMQKTQLLNSLNSADKIREALNYHDSIYQSFAELHRQFASLEEVKKDYQEVRRKLEREREELKNIEKTLSSLQQELQYLANSTDIEQAHEKLNEARNNLRSLAERYAVNRSVSFLLEKLREKIINKTRDELLKPASEIMAEITEGDYSSIEPPDDLNQSDFKTVLSNGESKASVEYLSRGTMEQLFLAVRLSRIQEIKPPLPVFLDDSLVNFDRAHLYHSAEIISRLAESNQIFVLTCHPQLVKYIQKISNTAQYWYLEQGRFQKSNGSALLKKLSK